MSHVIRAGLILCGKLLIFAGAGCAASRSAPPAQDMVRPTVEQFGAMREVMREGNTEPRIGLTDAVAKPHAVAVGALEGLAGEITIADGDVWVGRAVEGDLPITGPDPIADDRATLLTLAHVSRWQTMTIEAAVEGLELEELIEQAARTRGIDTTRPFPFLIEGQLTDLNFHVINGYCVFAPRPATVGARPWRWSCSQPTDAIIVGFFAPDADGVMTHHGTSVHAHAIVSIDGRTLTGHVDRVGVEPGMTLCLPAAGPNSTP